MKDCNDDKLALILKRLPLTSFLMGHAKIQGTVRDYLNSDNNNIELEFIYDIFTLTTEDIIKKWYDGHESAFNLIKEIDKITNKGLTLHCKTTGINVYTRSNLAGDSSMQFAIERSKKAGVLFATSSIPETPKKCGGGGSKIAESSS